MIEDQIPEKIGRKGCSIPARAVQLGRFQAALGAVVPVEEKATLPEALIYSEEE